MPGLPPNGAVHGIEIDGLMLLIHGVMVMVFCGWLTYFAVVLVRGHRRKKPVDPGGRGARWGIISEAGIATIEIAILVGLAIPFWISRVSALPNEHTSTVIRVVAEQFAWNIHYPGPDGVFGRTDPTLVTSENPVGLDRTDPFAKDDIVTLNVMHVPVDKPVLLYLSSKDVIHSFSLPLFRIKQDAIPGQRIPVWFTPFKTSDELRDEEASTYDVDPSDSVRDLSLLTTVSDIKDSRGQVVVPAGTFLSLDVRAQLGDAGIRTVKASPSSPTEIACAQLCGLGHYRMRGFLTVESDSAYKQWTREQIDAAATQ
jgi:cytochrome c oxidase subunit 2